MSVLRQDSILAVKFIGLLHKNCSTIFALHPLVLIFFSYICRSTGPGGTAVLHTIANNGGCSDTWGNILKVSKDVVDKEMKRALEYKFQRNITEDPLATVYKYWEDGFW